MWWLAKDERPLPPSLRPTQPDIFGLGEDAAPVKCKQWAKEIESYKRRCEETEGDVFSQAVVVELPIGVLPPSSLIVAYRRRLEKIAPPALDDFVAGQFYFDCQLTWRCLWSAGMEQGPVFTELASVPDRLEDSSLPKGAAWRKFRVASVRMFVDQEQLDPTARAIILMAPLFLIDEMLRQKTIACAKGRNDASMYHSGLNWHVQANAFTIESMCYVTCGLASWTKEPVVWTKAPLRKID
jgi:hypothetical protein